MKEPGFTQLKYANNILAENKRLLGLWQQSKDGDGQAFGNLAKSQYKILFNHAFENLTSDKELIKDTIQDLFLHVWERRGSIEIKYVTIYFIRALRNRLITHNRKFKTVNGLNEFFDDKVLDESANPEAELMGHEYFQENEIKLNAAMALLSERQQKVISLKFYMGYDNEKISEILGINRQSVANLLYRAIEAMKASVYSKSPLLVLLFMHAAA